MAKQKRKSPGPSVKRPKTYEALRDKGMSKRRAARISNAQDAKKKGAKSGGKKNSGTKKKSGGRKKSGKK